MSRTASLEQIEAERAAAELLAEAARIEAEPVTSSPYAVLSQEKNAIKFPAGLSGSLTQLADGNSYLIAGANVQIVSVSNGPITISAPDLAPSVPGTDGDVQFNDGGIIGSDTLFKFNDVTKTLTVPNLSSSLTCLSNNSPYLLASGLVSLSTGSGAVTVVRTFSDDISTKTWQSYTPEISASPTSPTLPDDIVAIGKYVYAGGTMKLVFSLSSRVTAGAGGGSGTYLINMPVGYEIDTDIVPTTSVETFWGGISLAPADISLDAVGGGGTWTVVPISASQLMLVGKAPADTALYTWGSDKFPFGAGDDYRVSFTATIPSRIATNTYTYLTAGTIFVEGTLTINSGTTVNLYNSVYQYPGTYVLFDYSAVGASFTGNQSTLDSNVTLSYVDLPGTITSGASLIDDSANKRILLRLPSNPLNGKVFVEGNLTFTGATIMTLDQKLYGTSGIYELFEFAGTSSGVSQYLTCVSAAGFTCGTPYVEGNLVKVLLS